MRTGLIAFGIIFLVLGIMAYFIPTQTTSATTTTVAPDRTDTRTSYTSFDIPWVVTNAVLIIGGILMLAGLIIPDPVVKVKENIIVRPRVSRVVQKPHSTSYDIHTEDKVVGRGQNKRVVHERHVHRRAA